MSIAAKSTTQERDELDAVLASGIFNRAPNLASFLKYVCEKHFQGQADSIKEYSIAVEALRRPADFDQRKDSIVRVEAHRLRKRLADFYLRGAGSDHLIQIQIPNGQYAPQFVYEVDRPVETVAVVTVSGPPGPAASVPLELPLELLPSARVRRSWIRTVLLATGAVLLVLAIFFAAKRVRSSTGGENWAGSYADPVPNEYRFLPGYHGPAFTDRQGRVWQPDAYFQGGTSIPLPGDWPVDGLPDPAFPKNRREGTFTYSIPERDGTYEIHLHFIGVKPRDPSDAASNSQFRLLVNGQPALEAFDPTSEAGGFDRFHSRVIRDVSPAKDGRIQLSFQPWINKAFVSAIEILSSQPGKARPVRIVAAKSSVVDSNGLAWVADEDAFGGFLVERSRSIGNPDLKVLFAGEHFGNFAYHIPMPPGRYRVKLYFAETYFGEGLPAAIPANGARLFNVYANGLSLLHEFDVAKEAGGPNRAVVREFQDIEPNAQGNIDLEFVPLRNYAEVNAIEVSQME